VRQHDGSELPGQRLDSFGGPCDTPSVVTRDASDRLLPSHVLRTSTRVLLVPGGVGDAFALAPSGISPAFTAEPFASVGFSCLTLGLLVPNARRVTEPLASLSRLP